MVVSGRTYRVGLPSIPTIKLLINHFHGYLNESSYYLGIRYRMNIYLLFLGLFSSFQLLVNGVDEINEPAGTVKTKYHIGGADNNIRIYLLNLDRRPERLIQCDLQLRKHGLNYTRFSAIDSHVIKHRQYDKLPTLHPDTKFDMRKYMGDRVNCQHSCGAVGK